MKVKPLIALGLMVLIALFLLARWVYLRSFADFESHAGEGSSIALIAGAQHPIETLGLLQTPTVLSDVMTHSGKPAEVACTTCHSTKSPVTITRKSEDLDEFHQGLIMEHGSLTCLSCHNEENYDTLKLADGSEVGFEHVMQLCGQCHGPQTRDYRNGSHGGMSGYWDLSRGPRQRNACTVCHDAHAPAFPQLMPVFPPKDIIPPRKAPRSQH